MRIQRRITLVISTKNIRNIEIIVNFCNFSATENVVLDFNKMVRAAAAEALNKGRRTHAEAAGYGLPLLQFFGSRGITPGKFVKI